jgi:phage regulator Rha-like protein
MAQAARQFQELGFRVIEGGKSSKIALLKTPGITEMFGVRHDHVLRDIRDFQSGSPNLGSEFAEHCRPSEYRDSRGKDQPCFELTKVGFLTVGLKYDPPLRFLLALAFDALERDTDSDHLIQQINGRIRELRSHASGQDELSLERARIQEHGKDLYEAQERLEQGELFSQASHPSNWSASYTAWAKDYIEIELPRPVRRDANQRHLDCITDMGHTPQGYGDGSEDKPTIFMREELPIGHSADSWRVWISEQWFRLPLDLRREWWRDTDYGRSPPSPEMIEAIIAIALP